MSDLLPEGFYERDALAVARDLLGQHLVRDDVVLRITEVEAYRHPGDTANHCRAGRTARNAGAPTDSDRRGRKLDRPCPDQTGRP